MKKDIIYIDVEDDITAIIGKVKSSAEKVVALVPPKRVGVLQSAVNLRLLQRTAEQSDKHIVLITGNQALTGLAAAASIPVARNLQSKPELAEIPALDIDDGNDVIDGAQLPVGDHAAQATTTDEDNKDADLIEGISLDEPKPAQSEKRAPKKASANKKVPNFNAFRKKLIIGIIAGVLLIGGLVWAFVFAPAATVIITARTTEAPVNDVATFGSDTNAEQGVIRTVNQTLEKEVSVEFEATGEKDVGEKAEGTVRFTSSSPSGQTIPAGTSLTTSGGLVFTLSAPVNLPGATLSFGCGGICPATASGTVTASESGEKYNAATGSLSGAPSGVSASLTGPTGGGTSKTVPMVTAADVQAAKEKLVKQSSDDVKKELAGKFSSSVKVIEASFRENYGDVTPKPAIGSEASDKKAAVAGKVTYTITGIEEADLRAYLEQTLKKQMPDQTTQKIYDAGVDGVNLNDFTRSGNTQSIRIIATGQIGPVIDEANIKEKVAGKRLGDIQDELKRIDGVSDVEVKFSFFWVRTVPSNPEKITIEFDVSNASS